MPKYKIEIIETSIYEYDLPSGYKVKEQIEALLTDILDSGVKDYSWSIGNVKRLD